MRHPLGVGDGHLLQMRSSRVRMFHACSIWSSSTTRLALAGVAGIWHLSDVLVL